MGPETIKIPMIDFSNLKQQTPAWEMVKTQVQEALEEYGCFEATFDQVPLHLRELTFDVIPQLFDVHLETKLRNNAQKAFHGYIGQRAAIPLYESLGIEDALSLGKLDSFTHLMWPEGNPNFSKTILAYCEQLSELDKIVRRMVLESLGLEKYMDEHMDSTNYLARVQKYGRPQSNESELGLSSHTDKNTITILCQNEVRGLEVLTKDGQWINLEPSPHSFVVMVGDSFLAWTNGRLHSPVHRVMMAGEETRYSIGLFSTPKAGYIVKTPEEMVDEEHPLLFKPFDHRKFMDFFYTHADPTSPDCLKEYCGV